MLLVNHLNIALYRLRLVDFNFLIFSIEVHYWFSNNGNFDIHDSLFIVYFSDTQ